MFRSLIKKYNYKVSRNKTMRLYRKIMGPWKVWLGLVLLAHQASSSATDNIDWSTENKNTYCDLISRRRIYRQQRLEIYCQVKVLEVDQQV